MLENKNFTQLTNDEMMSLEGGSVWNTIADAARSAWDAVTTTVSNAVTTFSNWFGSCNCNRNCC